MNTRGYSSYHGRGSGRRSGGGKGVWAIVVCVLVLLAAAAYLLAQRYLVYDEDGTVRWELPFDKAPEEPQPPENPISPEDVVIEREEPKPAAPVRRAMPELRAQELEIGVLWWEPDYVLSEWEGDLVIEIKSAGGGLRYGASVSVPGNVVVERGATEENLRALLSAGRYTVARVHCFRDSAYTRGDNSAALQSKDGEVWYDGEGESWLDPGGPAALAYLTALCRELGELGFKEILLDDFCYPSTGDTASIDLPADADKTAILADFAAAIRKAVPETTALGVAIHAPVGEAAGTDGLTAALVYGSFDRVYADSGVDVSSLTSLEGFKPDTELALLTYSEPDHGSFVLLN